MSIDHPDTLLVANNDDDDNCTADRTIFLSRQNDSALIQYLIPRDVVSSRLIVRSSCAEDCLVSLHVTGADRIINGKINSSVTIFDFQPYHDDYDRLRSSSSSMHYVVLRLETGNFTNVTIKLDNAKYETDRLNFVKLTRKSLPDFFVFDYDHLPINATKNSPVNVKANDTTVLKFKVGSVYDIGGTLSVGLRLAELTKDDDDEDVDDDYDKKIIVVGCLSLGVYYKYKVSMFFFFLTIFLQATIQRSDRTEIVYVTSNIKVSQTILPTCTHQIVRILVSCTCHFPNQVYGT